MSESVNQNPLFKSLAGFHSLWVQFILEYLEMTITLHTYTDGICRHKNNIQLLDLQWEKCSVQAE